MVRWTVYLAIFKSLLTARDFRFFKSQLTVWDNRFLSPAFTAQDLRLDVGDRSIVISRRARKQLDNCHNSNTASESKDV